MRCTLGEVTSFTNAISLLHSLFSNPIIYSGSQYMTGLNSAVATFTPSDSPYSFAAQADTMEYVAMGYFDVTGTISQDAAAEQEVRESSQDVLKLAEVPWFGDRTGDTITQVSETSVYDRGLISDEADCLPIVSLPSSTLISRPSGQRHTMSRGLFILVHSHRTSSQRSWCSNR